MQWYVPAHLLGNPHHHPYSFLTVVYGLPLKEQRALAASALLRVGLSGREQHYPTQLSGGQQQRVAIVRALAMEPELMLLDEVTAALDPVLVGEVLQVIRDMRSRGMTMVLATHEMQFAREISDTVCFLKDGRILEAAPPSELFTSPQQPETREFLERVIASGRL